MDPLSLRLWKADTYMLPKPMGATELEVAYQAAVSAGQMLAHVARGGSAVEQADAHLELRYTMICFAQLILGRKHERASRMVCQDPAQTMAITIDTLSPPRVAPPGISYAGIAADEEPPLLPVRWLVGTKAAAYACAQAMVASAGDSCPLGGDYRLTSQCNSKIDELNLMKQVLEESTAKVSPRVQEAFAKSPLGHGGKFKLGYLPVLRAADADVLERGDMLAMELQDPEKHGEEAMGPCHNDSCSNKSTSRCGECKGAYYCSPACQKADWKARHKMVCTGPAGQAARAKAAAAGGSAGGGKASESAPAAPERKSVTMPLGNKQAPDNILASFSRKTGGMHVATKGEIPAGTAHKGEFLVKVQVPLGGGASAALMVYDQGRTFQEFLPGDTAAGRELTFMIRQQGVSGIKGYFQARREGDNLRIYTDRIAPPQPW